MKRENKRDDIFRCALQLFSEKGYEAVSPNEIVEMVGVTKPTLYYFFGSKEGLFDELLKTNYQSLDALMARCCVYTPDPGRYYRDVYPVLLQVVKALFAFAEENTAFYLMSLSFSFAPPYSKTATVSEPYHREHYLIVEQLFKEIAAVHSNMTGKERLYAWRFLADINANIGLWHRGYGNLDEDTSEAIVRGFMHGMFS